MIMKYLLLFIVLVIAYQIWRKQQRLDAAERQGKAAPRAPKGISQEKMVPCARCGLMLPVSDALGRDGRHYCCAEHRQQGPAD